MTAKTFEIYTVHHKRDDQLPLLSRDFVPIQVGAANSVFDLGIRCDNVNGRLSAKNDRFCELTALDEIAGSISGEYVGLMHYRRIFALPQPYRHLVAELRFQLRILKCSLGIRRAPIERHHGTSIRTMAQLEATISQLKNYIHNPENDFDVILPMPGKYFGQTLRSQYGRAHHGDHLELFVDQLTALFPQLAPYVDAPDQNNRYYFFNMFIMRAEMFAEYWEMLSTTLFAIEDRIDADALDPYQRRVFGFLAERYMSIFAQYIMATGKYKVMHLPVAFCKF